MADPQQTATPDLASSFRALPPERQKALLGKMNDQQKANLTAALRGGKKAKATAAENIAKQKLEPEPSLTGKIARGAALGAFEGAGIKPGATKGEVIGGTLKKFSETISGPTVETGTFAQRLGQQYEQVARFPVRLGTQLTESAEQAGRAVRHAVQNKDWEAAAEHATSMAVQLLMLRGSEEAAGGESELLSKAARMREEGISPSLTQNAARQVIQKHLFDRATKVQEHLTGVESRVKARDAANWQYIENTVDQAKPEGAVDLAKIAGKTREEAAATVKIPERVPETVKQVSKVAEPELPIIDGKQLDPNNPAHAQLIDAIRSSGGLPELDAGMASFGKVRQFRSKLGRELQSPTLSGEARSLGWKLYGQLTDAMRAAAEEHGLGGAFKDANEFHAQYRDDFGKGSPLGKSIAGDNPHEIVGPHASPRTAEQARRAAQRYQQFGADPKMLSQEARIFDKYKSGLPRQIPMTRWELLGDVGAVTGGIATGRPELLAAPVMAKAVREAYNFAQRAKAIREVRAQAISQATQKLGPKASIRQIMEEADKTPSPVAPPTQPAQPAPTAPPAPAGREVQVTPESQRPSPMGGTAGRVMSMISREGGNLVSAGQIARETGLSASEVQSILTDLEKSGQIDLHRGRMGGEATESIYGAQLKRP